MAVNTLINNDTEVNSIQAGLFTAWKLYETQFKKTLKRSIVCRLCHRLQKWVALEFLTPNVFVGLSRQVLGRIKKIAFVGCKLLEAEIMLHTLQEHPKLRKRTNVSRHPKNFSLMMQITNTFIIIHKLIPAGVARSSYLSLKIEGKSE